MSESATNILWFEDSPAEQCLIAELAEQSDPRCRIEFVGDGREAPARFAALARLPTAHAVPALVVLDVHMPAINGIEILAMLREHESLRTSPVAFFTTSDRAAHVVAARALGAIGYYLKDGEPSAYAAAIDEILGLARGLHALSQRSLIIF